MRHVFLFIMLVSCSCSHTLADGNGNLRPSELNAKPSIYDGKYITVEGYIIIKPSAHVLYESKAIQMNFERLWNSNNPSFDPRSFFKYCVTIANRNDLVNLSTRLPDHVSVRAKFIAKYLDDRHFDPGSCPLPTAVIIDVDDLKRRYRLQ